MALALLFDFDGTLFDTFEAIVESISAAFAEFGLPAIPADVLRPLVGVPFERQLETLLGMPRERADEVGAAYHRHFRRHVEEGAGVRVYPGVPETLAALAGRPIGTMTTRRRSVAELMLRKGGIDRYFRAVTGGDEVRRPKPEPDLPLLGAKALGSRPQETAVVGDAPVDILAGRAAGMRTVAATYGYGDPRELRDARPHATIARFADLPRVLEALERARAP